MENLCLYLIINLFSTFNQHSNIGPVWPNHLDLILTNNCVIILGADKALSFFQLCDHETVKTQEWLPSWFFQRLCLYVVVSLSQLGFSCSLHIKIFKRTLKPDHLAHLKLIGI